MQSIDRVNKLLTNNFENTYSYTNAGIRLRTQKRNTIRRRHYWQQSDPGGKKYYN